MKKMFLLFGLVLMASIGLPPPEANSNSNVAGIQLDQSVTVAFVQNTLPTFLAELNELTITAEVTQNQIISTDETVHNGNDNQMVMLFATKDKLQMANKKAGTDNFLKTEASQNLAMVNTTLEELAIKKVASVSSENFTGESFSDNSMSLIKAPMCICSTSLALARQNFA